MIIKKLFLNTWPSYQKNIEEKESIIPLFCFETLKIRFWKDIGDERGQRTEKNWTVPASGKRWRESNLRFAASRSSLFDHFQIVLKFYRESGSFFREKLSAKSIFFFFYREKFISKKKKYTLTLLFIRAFPSTVDCNVEKERNGEKNNRRRGKNNSPARKGTLKKRKKIKRPVV